MAAIAITTKEHGPVTIPLTSINVVRRGANGKAVIEFQSHKTIEALEDYQRISDDMISTHIRGTVSTEQIF